MVKRKAKSGTTRKIGRPPQYTRDSFIAVVKKYLNTPRAQVGIHNKAGLLLALDLSRESWRRYKENPDFSDTIRKAEAQIEDEWVRRLVDGGSASGPIFYLKNAFKEEYKDRQETDITTGGEKIGITGMIIQKT